MNMVYFLTGVLIGILIGGGLVMIISIITGGVDEEE